RVHKAGRVRVRSDLVVEYAGVGRRGRHVDLPALVGHVQVGWCAEGPLSAAGHRPAGSGDAARVEVLVRGPVVIGCVVEEGVLAAAVAEAEVERETSPDRVSGWWAGGG